MIENYDVARTRVKICGITRLEDAIKVVDAGADAIGFVFYKLSERYVLEETAMQIARALPPFISKVGLFVNASHKQIETTLKTVPVDVLQFHGEEDPQECQRYGLPYIKAVRMRDQVDIHRFIDDYASASALLLDSFADGMYGGTGRSFSWSAVPVNLGKRIILAGGLTTENVINAIAKIAPYAVDVSSGVEKEPGIKDLEKVKKFMQAVMRYEK